MVLQALVSFFFFFWSPFNQWRDRSWPDRVTGQIKFNEVKDLTHSRCTVSGGLPDNWCEVPEGDISCSINSSKCWPGGVCPSLQSIWGGTTSVVHFLWTSIGFHLPRTVHSLVASSSFKYLLAVGEVAPPGTLAAGAREGGWGPSEAGLGSLSKCYTDMLLLFGHQVLSDSLPPRGLQHASLPCPSLSPGIRSNSYLSSW